MNHHYIIETKRLILRPLSEEYIEDLRQLRNRMNKFFYSQDIISVEGQTNWFNNYLIKEDDLMFSIFHKNNPNEYIGSIALYGINKASKEAEFGRIMVDKDKCSDKGVGTEAIYALLKFAFHNLGLIKIIATVKTDNNKAIDVYNKVGFIKCGEIKELDAYIYEITEDKYMQGEL